MMGVLTFRANGDRAERVLVQAQAQGNSSMASNSALEADYEYVDNVEPDLVLIGLVGLHDLLWLWNAEFEDHA
jgi:hypothetical protein